MIKKTKKITSQEPKSTYDEYVEAMSPKRKREFEEGYKEFALSEFLLAAMEEDEISVRQLAKLAGVSPTIVQAMRSGSQKDFSMKSFLKILKGLGFNQILIARDGHEAIPLSIEQLSKR